jgi:hypothetical protein
MTNYGGLDQPIFVAPKILDIHAFLVSSAAFTKAAVGAIMSAP